ncbi:MAG: hypothetical protein H3C30_01195, partial [Candidatus Hydrogenedentes bacterium]|nr:hypothetical protein [Candidatus Hydrogenedentota bacterium]
MIGNIFKGIGLFVVLFLALGIVGTCMNASKDSAGNGGTKPAAGIVMPGKADIVTYEMYNRIANGSCKEVSVKAVLHKKAIV